MSENTIHQPIMQYENEEQLNKSLKEWQDRLFLNDWIIKVSIVDEIFDDNGEQLQGQNIFQIENKSSHIKLLKPNEDATSRIVKFCMEVTLVHELLHCKYNWCAAPQSHEGVYYDVSEHALIEQMAKSLIMAKYDLPFDWFKNF